MRRARLTMAAIAVTFTSMTGLAHAAGASTGASSGAVLPAPAPADQDVQRYGHQSIITPVIDTGGSSGPSGASAAATPKPPKITYHGGDVMSGKAGVNIYLIWYGNWASSADKSLITGFFTDLSGSKYHAINVGYTAGKNKITNKLTLAGQVSDAYSQGATNLSDAAIQSIVTANIGQGKLAADPSGVYFVLTSADVTKTGFMTSFCGWHTYATIASTDIKYSFVGNANKSSACTPQQTSPNNNPAIDALLSVVAHELSETVTDPHINAWFDSNHDENADKCAWNFGKILTATNGSKYNVEVGSHQYYLQQNWKKAGSCALR